MELTGQKPSEFDTATKNSLKTALGIASNPNVKRYKAILVCPFSGQYPNFPLGAHVLNANDSDFLGELTFEPYNFDGTYVISGYPFTYQNQDGFVPNISSFFVPSFFSMLSGGKIDCIVIRNIDEIFIRFVDSNNMVYILSAGDQIPFEITVIERNSIPATLLSAELPASGDKFILTFDKPISPFRINEGINIGGIMGNNMMGFLIDYEVSTNVLELIISPLYSESLGSNSICNVSINLNTIQGYGYYLEATDFSLVPEYIEFPVTNNMLPN